MVCFFAVVFSPRHSPNFVRLCARLGENICFRSPFPCFRPDTRRSGSARRRRRSNKDTIKPCAMQIYLHGRGEVSKTKSKIRISLMQKQFYLRLTEAKASKTKPKTGKAERKREPVPVFRSASYLKTMMSKIRKGESNRADLYAKIAEPHPIFGKDSTNHIQNKQVLSEHGLIFAKLTSTFLLKQLISDSSDNRNSVRNNSCKGNVTNRLKNTHPIWQKRQHRPTNHLPKGTK